MTSLMSSKRKINTMQTKWQGKLNRNPLPWLLESNPWTKYKTLTDLMDMPLSSLEVKRAKQELCNNTNIKSLIKESSNWIVKAPTRYIPDTTHT